MRGVGLISRYEYCFDHFTRGAVIEHDVAVLYVPSHLRGGRRVYC